MHIRGVDQRAHRKHRTRPEKVLQRVNTIVVAIQLACFLIVIAQMGIATSHSMSNNFFTFSSLHLSQGFAHGNCSVAILTGNLGFNNFLTTISTDNVQFIVTRAVYDIRRSFAMYCTALGIGALNKLFFDVNIHSLTYHHLRFRKEVLTVLELFCWVLALVALVGTQRDNSMLQTFSDVCGDGSGNEFQYYSPYYSMYVGVAVTLFVHFITMLMGLKIMTKKHPKDNRVAEEGEETLHGHEESEPEDSGGFQPSGDESARYARPREIIITR
jgi:hypothetical protein